jgi:hypothetical protein
MIAHKLQIAEANGATSVEFRTRWMRLVHQILVHRTGGAQ